MAAALCGIISLAACNSKSATNSKAETGAELDSMVNQATSAVNGAADSVKQPVHAAMDSTGSKIDSAMSRH